MGCSDEVLASDSGIVHPVHCVTRDDVTFFNDGDQLDFRRWRQADMVKVRLRGHKGDQLQEGSTIVRTRSEVNGVYPGLRAGGGAVALMARNRPTLLVSERTGGTNMGIWTSSASIEIVSGTGGNPEEYALHSSRIGGVTALAAGGSASEGDSERRPLEIGRVQDLHPKQLTILR